MKRAIAVMLLLAASVVLAEPLDDAKKLADDSIRLALQLQAAAAGGDRGEAHRAAEKKLQEALELFRKSADAESYHRAADLAGQARALFAESRPPAPAIPAAVAVPAAPPAPGTARGTAPTTPTTPANNEPKVESAALATARIAVQQYRRHLVEAGRPATDAQRLEALLVPAATPATLQRVAEEAARNDRALAATVKTAPERAQLEAAFRAYAAGNLDGAEQLLATAATAEALLLRGCVRATRGLLARAPEAALAAARTDFRAALQLDPGLSLDPHVFSPKVIVVFQGTRLPR
jgi:hypothetical protein